MTRVRGLPASVAERIVRSVIATLRLFVPEPALNRSEISMVIDGNTARALPWPDPDESSFPPAPDPSPAAEPHQKQALLSVADWLIAACLVLFVGVASTVIAGSLPSFLLHSMDFWFEADTIREVSNMISTTDDHSRTSVHPLFSLLAFTPVFLVKHLFDIPALQAVLYVTGLLGGLWSGTLFLMLRLMGCRPLDAGLFTLLSLSSASAIFWLPVPNSYTWGSWTIMSALIVLLVAEQRRLGGTAYVVASALTLSITVTNWMSGLLATVARWPLKQAIQLSINAFCLVVLLWGAQKFIFPSAEFFIGSRKEATWVNHPQSGQMQHIAASFGLHTLVAPAVRLMDDDGYIQHGDDSFRLSQRLAFQFSAPGSGGLLGLTAVGLWAALLLMGVWSLMTVNRQWRFRVVLTAMLLFEFSLHMVYGEETFTYSMNFLPLLIAVTAFGTLGRRRPWVLVLAGALTLCAGLNNWQQFRESVELATHFTPQREAMLDQMQKDPGRPWPRSVGHIPLAVPGSAEADHAYHEPGGDFSPQTPSFGVSLWLCDNQGRPLVTSQTMPLTEIHQTFEPSAHPDVPAIATKTPYYDASWSRLDATHWELRFTHHSSHRPAILIRSVGPAGGPVTELQRDGNEVTVNRRWVIRVTPAPADITLGDETGPQGLSARSSASTWKGSSGWGYARVTLAADSDQREQEFRLVLEDRRVPIEMQRYYRPVPEAVHVDLPEPQFQKSMDAQRSHLMMGLISGETRPGDPTVFVRAWQRQGAYITAALSRAGDPHVGWVLSRFLATHDFAGGAGPEADAPGLAIWALTESAAYLADSRHDQWLWPHILRKAKLIEDMLHARGPIVTPFVVPSPYDLLHGQQVRMNVLAKPAREGVIVGRIGHQWPSLYVNAVSYRGLVAAAEFADRLGKHRQAAAWNDEARTLLETWLRVNVNRPAHFDESSIRHASFTVPTPQRNPLSQPMTTYRPAPDHLTIAGALTRAHRLLRLGRPEEVWDTLHHVWGHQASPGLFTWETTRATTDDVADGWQYVRGWRDRTTVSPDYETAALLLLLQQDMLAYLDTEVAESPVVIGAGIPSNWLSQPLAVSNLLLPGGSITWTWDGHGMHVTLKGPIRNIRLGSAFPPGTRVSITHEPLPG